MTKAEKPSGADEKKAEKAEKRADFDISGESIDPLLECLAWLTKHYGHAKTPEALVAGMPVDEKGLTPTIFCEAAAKSGLNSRIVQRNFLKIPDMVLPAVLILRGGNACVLIQRGKSGKLKVMYPETGGVSVVSQKEVMANYTGYAIFVRPMAESARQEEEERHSYKHWFWGPMAENTGIYMRVAIAAVLINIFGLVSPLFIMNVYDRVLPNNAIETGWVLAIGALSIFLFDLVIRMLRGYFIDLAGRRADVIVARRIYDQVLDMRMDHRPASTGVFADRLREFEAVRDFFTSATLAGFVDLPFTVLYLFVIWAIAGPVAWLLAGLVVMVLLVGLVIQLPLRRYVTRTLATGEAKHGLLVETINGLETIKGAGAEGRFRSRYGQYVADAAEGAQTSRLLSSIGVNFATFAQQSAGVLVVLMGMYLVAAGDLSMGALIACVILGSRAIAPIGQVAQLVTRYHTAITALRSLNAIMATPVERPAEKKFLHRPDIKGAFAFSHVHFSYPGLDRQVLRDISFTINPGERVAIIGRVGSGKSTLLRLMMGFYEPTQGAINVDDTDMRQIDPADLRRSIGFIGQDAMLFRGTVRENITAGRPRASDQDVFRVAKQAGVHEFVRKHPLGYDAQVGERGEGLSGGQRQAVALARALLTRPQVLMCDEPTSSMDNTAEQAFVTHVRENTDMTLLLVTHRHNLLDLVDRIILLHEGQLVADGPRDKVIEAINKGVIKIPGPAPTRIDSGPKKIDSQDAEDDA